MRCRRLFGRRRGACKSSTAGERALTRGSSMCFSAEASFAAAGALIPAGMYCVYSAGRKAPRTLLVALVPIAFGVHQAMEGCVWLGLRHGDASAVQVWSAVYLFFAVAFWPIWIPLSLAVAEQRVRRRLILAFFAAVGLVWLGVILPA